jgi:hypothetical protein
MLKNVLVLVSLIGAAFSGHPLHDRAITPGRATVPTPVTRSYQVGIGIFSGPIISLRSAYDGQRTQTKYSMDPSRLARLLIAPHYFQVMGVVSGTRYTYPWRFQRTDRRHEADAIVTFGYNETQHMRVVAVGIPTGTFLQTPAVGHTASGGAVPSGVTMPTGNGTTSINCGISCTGTILYPSFTSDTAYFDPVGIKLTEGKLNMSCTTNNASIYDCKGWWWAYWAGDGWQLNHAFYSAPFFVWARNPQDQQEWTNLTLDFEHPWFCAGQATYVTYDPLWVTIGLHDYTTDNGSWTGTSGACTWLLTSVVYG